MNKGIIDANRNAQALSSSLNNFLRPQPNATDIIEYQFTVPSPVAVRQELISYGDWKTLCSDVSSQFLSVTLTRSIKQTIYQNYCDFVKKTEHAPTDYDNFNSIIQKRKNWPSASKVDQAFLELYFSKVTVIFILKSIFLHMISRPNRPITEKTLCNSSSFFNEVFKKNSSTELRANIFLANHYSWYRPSAQNISLFYQKTKIMAENYSSLTTEHLLNLVIKTLNSFSLNEEECLLPTSEIFSPLVSFLHQNILSWIGKNNSSKDDIFCVKSTGESFNQLFNLSSLNEEKKINVKQENIYLALERDLLDKKFLGLISEFNYILNQIVTESKESLFPSIIKICEKTKKLEKRSISYNQEKSCTGNEESLLFQQNLFHGFHNELTFLNNEIFIHIKNFPKNNPNFYLFSQISTQVKDLRPGGALFVLSDKKVFAPSLSDRIHQLLDELFYIGSISFDELKGEKKLPNFVYIFTKKDPSKNEQKEKQNCFGVRFRGPIQKPEDENQVIQTLCSFIKQKSWDTTSLFYQDVNSQIVFEYYHDAIVDGKLLNSTTKDSSKITHPAFFKSLLASCDTLESFFQIRSINAEYENSVFDENGQTLNISEKNDFHQCLDPIAIVDLKKNDSPYLYLVKKSELFEIKKEIGTASIFVFQLTPLKYYCELTNLKSFFNSNIGKQIVQIFLSGPPSKIKNKLTTLLIPRFLLLSPQLKIEEKNYSIEKTLSLKEEELFDFYQQEKHSFNTKEHPSSPREQVYFLSNLKSHFQEAMSYFESSSSHKINFNNKYIIQQIIECEKNFIYPKNNDFYFEFDLKSSSELQLPLTGSTIQRYKDDDQDYYFLEIISGEKQYLKIFSDYNTLLFLDFIIKNNTQIPIQNFLQQVQIPSVEDLKKIAHNYLKIPQTIETFVNEINEKLEEIFRKEISQKNTSL